jgi:di/tricarboxylate transporter
MAEVQEAHSSSDQGANDLARLKKDLEGYRELILPLNKVLEWEQNHYPAILVAAITFLFAIIWYLEPSVLTSFSLIGLTLCLVDFVVPTISGYLFASAEWTVIQERQFEAICVRLLNAKRHCSNTKTALQQLKNEKPKAYLLVMMGAFAVLAWIGSLIDNLLLTYLLVVFLALVPGLRKHGILQRVTAQAMDLVKKLVQGKGDKAPKSKTN